MLKNLTYLPYLPSSFNFELHILAFDDILRKLLSIYTKKFDINTRCEKT